MNHNYSQEYFILPEDYKEEGGKDLFNGTLSKKKKKEVFYRGFLVVVFT